MATNTPNLNLVKPEMADYADIRVLNQNMDILDTAVGGLDYVKNVTKSDEGLTFTKKDDTQINVPLDYMKITGGNFTGDITVKNVAPMYVIDEGSSEQYGAKYIKYSNGTMIQMFFYYPDSVSRKFIDVTFLQPFIEPPIIVGNRDKRSQMPTETREDLYNFTYEVAFSNVTTTGFKASVDDSLGASVFVWGRWK
jgi:hypothetical protein